MPDFVSLDSWKQEQSGAVRKQFIPEVKADGDSRALVFTITTDSVDRQGDTIKADGWDISAYRKNPVVLWAHDYSMLPVARATRVWREGNGLKARAEFTPEGLVKFNDIVFEMYKGGFLSAVSVGFNPTKWAFTEDKDRRYGVDFMEQELLEFSAVPVPANAEALIEARSAGADVDELRKWALAVIAKTGQPSDIREFEAFLRDSGFAKKDAITIASRGFCLRSESEAQPVAIKPETDQIARELIGLLRR